MSDQTVLSFRTPAAVMERVDSLGAERGWPKSTAALHCIERGLEVYKTDRPFADSMVSKTPRRGSRDGSISRRVPCSIKDGAQAVADDRQWRLSDAGNFLLILGLASYEAETSRQASKAKRAARAA